MKQRGAGGYNVSEVSVEIDYNAYGWKEIYRILQTRSFFISKFHLMQSRICRLFMFLRRKHEGSMDPFSGCSGGADVGNSALCASFLRGDLLRRQATDG